MQCKIRVCEQTARWTVTIEGHPNVEGIPTWAYCGKHIQGQAIAWDESPKPYTVTIRGPFPDGVKATSN